MTGKSTALGVKRRIGRGPTYALGYLLVLGGLGLVGPNGLLAWGEQLNTLDERRGQIALLEAERAELDGLVTALDPNNADPDLVGEIARRDLNVAHPDDYVLMLDD
ncbi:FtsB family cell division protein [Paraurantiacibacter namhicola]|uniref:Septum formation initiator n=1 Tax=Paraurantiacibacter namhicola TaxID=645517 RepID=A0A1C7D9B7_9SPHN|nr:septum formation initiator family protein [Paraurantiacibacter namhicola]ANU08048.1 Septum formation initiator [Paraurantiacibacter namhicola]